MEDLETVYLDYQEGETDTLKFDFGCQSRFQNSQNYGTYFILKLGDVDIDEGRFSQNEWFSEEINSKKEASYLGGIIYCNYAHLAQKYKNEFLFNFKQSIYFNIGNYQEAFSSSLNALQGSILSLDLFNEVAPQLWQEKDLFKRIKITVNLFMKVENKIYLSKSISPSSSTQNIWCYKEKGSNQYQQLSVFKDFKDQSSLYYQLKQCITNKLDELILSDSTNRIETITSNVKNQYPYIMLNQFYSQNMHFLKISNIF